MTTDPRPAGDDVFTAFCTAGLWPGLGRAAAGRLAEAGVTSVNDVTAERLARVEGVGPKRADRLVEGFTEAAPAYAVCELLVPAGAPARVAAGAVEALGRSAAAALQEDPWRLLGVRDVTPAQADAFARHLLGAAAHPHDGRRGRALVAWLLGRGARDGHTAMPAATVTSALAAYAVGEEAAAVRAALDDGQVTAFDDSSDGGERLGLTRYAMAEEAVAEGLHRLQETAAPVCRPEDVAAVAEGLDDTQLAAVAAFAAHGVSVLTGGPGTGKSRTVAAVVTLARQAGARVALAAPTGRAAKRLEELTDAPATTLHRLLGAQGTTGAFARGEHWPLDADVVVVDEASMLDVELAAALVEAVDDGSHLLLVGDPAQLPSIGPGQVLADVIDSGAVPVTELATLYRQAEGGAIARLATAVRAGDLPAVDSPDREVVVVPAPDSRAAAVRVLQLMTDSIPRALGIPAGEVQVVTTVHRGAAGTVALNAALKERLNPGPGEHAGFDPGDRVVATANHAEAGFANGEVGVVTGGRAGAVTVDFPSGPVTVPAAARGDLRHGWALTVHRAQGSEWPAVITVLPGDAAGMLSRPLVYTAFTRARRHLSVVHAAGPALARAVGQIGARPRRTRLARLLRAAD
jgi:exodeoxyribonuclease V alpha subunit